MALEVGDTLERFTTTTLKTRPPIALDRPGWIPPDVIQDWDPDPYAYQTEEELMPAGGPHGQILTYIMELVRHFLKARDLMFLPDIFVLYRDVAGVKRRIGPDLTLMPYRAPAPWAYDLDVEPLPLLVAEITSRKSRLYDLEDKVDFYLGFLGIPACLVIDIIAPRDRLREQIELHLWRLIAGQPREVPPGADGSLALPEMGLRIFAEGQQIKFVDEATGEVLREIEEERQVRQAAESRVDEERKARAAAESRADEERKARAAAETRAKEAETRLRELEAKLKQAGRQ